ncbi:hypothetical protein [Canibacter zhoujuaniae]|uniref:hypothetical protein n=1 Tax=Canibacter zhoujuaniae TaxID=2708343 RepID=UPI00141EE643|nr:hypothetical protein [Canibacter zhoujuaniae]
MREKRISQPGFYARLAIGICIGALAGVVLGYITDDHNFWLIVGLSLGFVYAFVTEGAKRVNKGKNKHES